MAMIAAVDSSYARPSPASVAAFRGAGVKMWNGYLATKGNVNLAATWSQADFEMARQLGADPIGYCSGWDDPVAVKKLAAAWRVKACLDDEGGIRPDGPWVQPWLDASGAGLYGNPPVFAGRHAPFFVDAAYPGYDPGRTWISGDPGVPHGWQWEGTHTEFGLSIDRGWFDDWFLQGDDMTSDQDALLRSVDSKTSQLWNLLVYGVSQTGGSPALNVAQLNNLQKTLLALNLPQPAAVDEKALAAALAQPLAEALTPHLPTGTDTQAIAAAVAKDVGVWLAGALPKPPA